MRVNFLFAFLLIQGITYSQQLPDFKFGKISAADFSIRTYAIDTGAHAVVIADIGATQVKGNDKNSVSLEYRHFKRVHILKTAGYYMATVSIPLYKLGDDEEQLKDLKAVTYNLVNGKVVESKLNVKSSVFKDKIDRNRVMKKFTFPDVKEGSIIEFEYKLVSDFLFNPQPWRFQGTVPRLWSQYTMSVPQFLDYVVIEHANSPYYISDQKQKEGNFAVESTKEIYGGKTVTERFDISCAVADYRWAMKDVPAFKDEPFTSSPENYISKLEFQLSGYEPPFQKEKVMTTWPDLAKYLLRHKNFGGQLINNEYWLPSLVSKVTAGASSQPEKARKIYEYVRDNFMCTGYSQLFTDSPLDKIASNKSGGVAEINLILVAMLRNAGLQADPVILSTRENGFVNPEYPVFRPFNYVICRINLDGKEQLLDASHPRLGYGKLHYDCYNGQARVVNETATVINLSPEQLTERKQTAIFLSKEPGGKLSGNVTKQYGYYASEKVRQKESTEGKGEILKELEAEYENDFAIMDLRLDSLKNYEVPVTAHFSLSKTVESGDIIYLNPVLGEHYGQNPFKSADRQYPVEIPYKLSELYTLNMDIPDGYRVEEMPKPIKIMLNEKNDGVFDYTTSLKDGKLTFSYRLELNRAIFKPEEYHLLREFFGVVVSKLDEQIVFKKKQ